MNNLTPFDLQELAKAVAQHALLQITPHDVQEFVERGWPGVVSDNQAWEIADLAQNAGVVL